jgi:hypothetical protein
MMIADHPYLACFVAFAFGMLAGWLSASLAGTTPQPPRSDDDITGIGA